MLQHNRKAGGLSIEAEAKRLNLLTSELAEMERGCLPNEGLTTMSGAEPLRRALQEWKERWHLADWCFDWALERLRVWSSGEPLDYPLDPIGTNFPAPRLPPWLPQLQAWKSYLKEVQTNSLARYRDEIEPVDRTFVSQARP